MIVRKLNRDEITELKVPLYSQRHNDTISYSEIASIDALVFEEVAGCDFTKDDFSCNN